MTKAPTKNGATGAYKGTTPTVATRRQNMKYKVSTVSTTASGVVPIKGATAYPEEPSIFFTREAWVKQCHLVDKCKKEVGWFALVDYDEKYNSFTITELVIPNQVVTVAETDIGKEDLADAAMELIEAGKDTSKMFAWFHSHVDMGVGPSPQDEYQVEDFLEDLADQPEVPAFIRGIQNKRGDLKLDVYYIQHGVAYQNVDYMVIHNDDPQWYKDIEAEIKTKVTERTHQQYNYGSGGNRNKAGKSRAPAHTSGRNPYQGGDQYAYQGAYDGYGSDWWDNDDIYADGTPVETIVDNVDTPKSLIPLEIDAVDYNKLEIVHQTTNAEVMLGPDGQLLICDSIGDVYDYQEYTEVMGETV